MKKFSAAILFGLLLFAAVLNAQSVQDFKVINKTGIQIYDLYVASANEEDWGEDILGVEVLEDGEEVMISFEGYETTDCLFDVMIGDTEGNYFWLEDVNLCEIHELIFTADNRKPEESKE